MHFCEKSVIICATTRGYQRLHIKRWELHNNLSVSFNVSHISCSLHRKLSSCTSLPTEPHYSVFYSTDASLFLKVAEGLSLTLSLFASLPPSLFAPSTRHLFPVSDIYQVIEASRTLVLLDKGATAGSASMIADSTAPPKQNSMELNQQAKGLTLETSRAPAQEQKYINQQDHCGFP